MKIIGLLTSVFLTFFSIGQKSYYFSDPLPSIDTKVSNVDSKYFGIYESSTAARSYEINEEGIFIISTNISSIDRSTIRESSTYDVRNNYLFGVIEDDSIPCVLQDDHYYFGIQNKEELVSLRSKNALTKLNPDTYVLNYYEDGLYTPVILKFEGTSLILKEFNYDLETSAFDHIENQRSIEGQYHDLVILTPNKSESDALIESSVFAFRMSLKKRKK